MGVDFDLFSSLEDALNGVNQWQFCNYDDSSVGMFRDCGPLYAIGGDFTAFTKGRAAAFYIYHGNVQPATPSPITTDISTLAFDYTSIEDFNGQGTAIGWIQYASCMEGRPIGYPDGYTQDELIDIAKYAITVKVLPSTDIPGQSETPDVALMADLCSNPIYALNNGYEMSFTVNESLHLVAGADTNNWIGTTVAKQGLSSTPPNQIKLRNLCLTPELLRSHRVYQGFKLRITGTYCGFEAG
eukprot:256698_1